MLEAARGIELPGGQIINTGGTLATAGDTQLAMSSKVIGGKLYAGFWGNVINQTGN